MNLESRPKIGKRFSALKRYLKTWHEIGEVVGNPQKIN
jgi:hypothetical protein